MSVHTLNPGGGSGSSSSAGLPSTALTRAVALLGATINTVIATDFENDQWHRQVVLGTGAVAISVTGRAGILLLSTGATASSVSQMTAHGAPSLIDNLQTSRWYLYTRMSVGAADANAICSMGMAPVGLTNPEFRVGIEGGVSTTNFAYALTNGGGSTIASGTGPALDTNYHDFELWNDGTTASVAIDGSTIGTTAASNLGTGAQAPFAVVVNGATAVNRTLNLDKLAFCCARN